MRLKMLRNLNLSMSLRYNLWTFQIIKKTLHRNSTCIDVGCHRESVLKVMMRYAKNGLFYAFEPIPYLFDDLKKDYSSDNCKLYNIALSDKKGTSKFVHVVSNPGYSGFLERRYDNKNEQLEKIIVHTDLLDNIIVDDLKIDFIKIDVEGAEYQVLLGEKRLIMKNKPIIIFECGLGGTDYYGIKSQDIFNLLSKEYGLHISRLDDYLLNRKPLNFISFNADFESNSNYYFIAHAWLEAKYFCSNFFRS